ncbi:transmembrane protein 273-like [Thunnus thynnus]|uniref:transmembrane protein 273-like n=1 Tax=Thunnus thynnus TaxID=8237 RepID=UPI003527B8FF
MRPFQTCGCLSSLMRAVLIIEYLLMGVRGDGEESGTKLEIKYVLIGTGIGLFFAIIFYVVKFCNIRMHFYDNNCTDGSTKRPSEPQLFTLSRLSQSEQPVTAVSSDTQC